MKTIILVLTIAISAFICKAQTAEIPNLFAMQNGKMILKTNNVLIQKNFEIIIGVDNGQNLLNKLGDFILLNYTSANNFTTNQKISGSELFFNKQTAQITGNNDQIKTSTSEPFADNLTEKLKLNAVLTSLISNITTHIDPYADLNDDADELLEKEKAETQAAIERYEKMIRGEDPLSLEVKQLKKDVNELRKKLGLSVKYHEVEKK